MSFTVSEFDIVRFESSRRLFPDAIESDPWVIYHGTSGYNAESIEGIGLDAGNLVVSREKIRRVTAIYEKIKWFGNHGGGYACLKPFSLDHDFDGSDKSLIFLAETSLCALLYATREFAGGEKLRALRHAFRDLDLYLSNPQVREEHMREMEVNYRCLQKGNANLKLLEDQFPKEVDLDWLRQELAELKEVRHSAEDAFTRHQFGVVYALRMREGDATLLRLNRAMGIEASTVLSPSRIIGKIIVPVDFEMTIHSRGLEEVHNRPTGGLLELLASRERQQRD